jgi:carbon-monoxide dehydrogenase medium subunit
MKPAPFEYAKPGSLEEVFDLLDRHGDDARILAGGQSLLPTLNMRLSEPRMLIDITGLDKLRGIGTKGGVLRIGALARYSEVKTSREVAAHAPLLSQAVCFVAHPAIRNKGTFGGSLANADPAAELPACVVALDAHIEIIGKSGRRSVAAAEFFLGLYETALRPGELLSAVEIPAHGKGYRSGFLEFARRSGDFAISGLAAHARFEGDLMSDVRLVFCGVDIKPVRAVRAGQALEGKQFSKKSVAQAGALLAEDLHPTGDIHASGETKLQLSRVLTNRVLAAMAGAD